MSLSSTMTVEARERKKAQKRVSRGYNTEFQREREQVRGVRAKIRKGRIVRRVRINGVYHPVPCLCFDCVHGAGKTFWDRVDRVDRGWGASMADEEADAAMAPRRLLGLGRR